MKGGHIETQTPDADPEWHDFGDALRKHRQDLHWSQKRLIKRLGEHSVDVVSQGTISKWEHGLQRPNPETVEVLEDIFGLSRGTWLHLLRYPVESCENDPILAEARRCHFHELVALVEILERQIEHLANTTPTSVLTKSSLSLSYPSGLASEGAYKDILFWTADKRHIKRLWLAVEEDRRFTYLRQHLETEEVWRCYEDWRRSWRQSLWFSYQLDAMEQGHMPSPKSEDENDRLHAELKADYERRARCHDCLMAELIKVRSRGTLPGTCDCCSA